MRSALFVSLAVLAVGCASSNNTARTKDEADLTQRQKAAAFNVQLGSDYLRQGDLSEAKEKLERAIEQDSRNRQAHMVLGLLYDRLGESDKAESQMQRAVSIDEKDAEIRNAYAVILCKHRKYAAGEKNALAASAEPLYKTPELALLNAGYCARDAGDAARAEKHFRRALEIQPRFAPALFEMANLEFKANQLLPARAFLERHLAVAQASPSSLLLGVKIETALGNRSVASDYGRRLRNDFPASEEAKVLADLDRSIRSGGR